MWFPRRLHGGPESGPGGEGPAGEAALRATVPPCVGAGGHGRHRQPPPVRRALLQLLSAGQYRTTARRRPDFKPSVLVLNNSTAL